MGASIAAALLIVLLFSHFMAETAFVLLGGYFIFWFAFTIPVLRISNLSNRVDMSYGVYLYAWPIQSIIIWNDRTINPWLLCVLTIIAACVAAYASWKLIEKPSLNLLRVRHAVPLPTTAQRFQKQSEALDA